MINHEQINTNDGEFCNSNETISMPPIVSPLSKNTKAQVPFQHLTGTNIGLSEEGSKKLKKSDSFDWFKNSLRCNSLAFKKLFLNGHMKMGEKRSHQGEKVASLLDKHGQGVLHLAAALGYNWAISLVLNASVIINLRDIHGWTALHWATHFGREKTLEALIAAGASAGAVTDSSTKYPTSRIAAHIASESGHGGIAGYLDEATLTSHLDSLTLDEDELSKASAAVEAERSFEAVSTRRSIQQTLGTTDDDLPLKHALAATQNSTLAAARIQAAFRAHSFRK